MRPEFIEVLNRLGVKEREALFSILTTAEAVTQEAKTGQVVKKDEIAKKEKRLRTEYLNHVRQEWKFFTTMYGGEDAVWPDEGLVEILLDKLQKDPDKEQYQLTGTIFAKRLKNDKK